MRIRIDHSTRYAYARPARFIIQTLRLTPKSSEGQQVREWRIETDVDARLRRSEDAFGNIVHSLYTERPTDALTIRVMGEVTTADTGGVLGGASERLSPLVFLRETPLTRPDAAIADFARSIAGGPPLSRMHALMAALKAEVAFEVGATSAAHTAAESFAQRRGVCQDHAQIFIAAARQLGVPARYVSGHLSRQDGQHDQEAAHAWAEAWVEDLGWVGFDPANGICPTEHYVRVAVGLDALGATPIRGTSYGGGQESLTVALHVRPVQQTQQQLQSRGWSA
ncbi:transglutaminase family protein [Brevundimonas sp.]|uniref:transglutaminase family protein n=1 Tax=Brevundimonas sp. TaxID=1871086 RepID=UPI000DAFD20D|nr:transglutaminase family protein [Brevundimonas sp.]PZU75916.1 MAG: transglutaminase [Brevundimonas sp.]